mmetsp:Transcript_25649/g.32692  ORF Transcript_25649/g.32692 Transcript_25649/m.32692 type:complete len:288 (+) Transcript_25649:647-1510(+)
MSFLCSAMSSKAFTRASSPRCQSASSFCIIIINPPICWSIFTRDSFCCISTVILLDSLYARRSSRVISFLRASRTSRFCCSSSLCFSAFFFTSPAFSINFCMSARDRTFSVFAASDASVVGFSIFLAGTGLRAVPIAARVPITRRPWSIEGCLLRPWSIEGVRNRPWSIEGCLVRPWSIEGPLILPWSIDGPRIRFILGRKRSIEGERSLPSVANFCVGCLTSVAVFFAASSTVAVACFLAARSARSRSTRFVVSSNFLVSDAFSSVEVVSSTTVPLAFFSFISAIF